MSSRNSSFSRKISAQKQLIQRIKTLRCPAVLAVNKEDTLEQKEKLLEVIQLYSQEHNFDPEVLNCRRVVPPMFLDLYPGFQKHFRSHKKEKLLEVIQLYSQEHNFDAVVPISAKNGQGVEALLDVLEDYLPKGPQLFPEGPDRGGEHVPLRDGGEAGDFQEDLPGPGGGPRRLVSHRPGHPGADPAGPPLRRRAPLPFGPEPPCIEANRNMTYDIHYHIRLIDAHEYKLNGYDLLQGFISGLHAGNYDIRLFGGGHLCLSDLNHALPETLAAMP